MSRRNEYQRIRDNIMRSVRRYKSKGSVLSEVAPLTPRQKGYKEATESDIAELKSWGKKVLTRLGAEDDIDRILGNIEQESQKNYRERNKIFHDDVISESDVYVYNFDKYLKTAVYSSGASKVRKWFSKVKQNFKSNQELADFLKEAEQEGLHVDDSIKYGKEKYADNYVGDMTMKMYQKGYINDNQAEEMLKGISELTEQALNFFSNIIG